MPARRDMPEWWEWELDCSLPHLRKRMLDRDFTEADLREVLEAAEEIEPNHEPGRWVVRAHRQGSLWEVVVEPLYNEQIVLVVTAYKVES
jgi:hypothetical protein